MKKLLLLIFLLYLSHCLAQNKSNEEVIDSIFKIIPKLKSNKDLIIAYTDLSNEYSKLDTEKGILFGNKGLQLSNKINWNEGKAKSLLCVGNNYFSMAEYEIALQNYSKALSLSESKKTIGQIYKSLCGVYYSKADNTKAIRYGFASLKISESLKDEIGISKSSVAIGNIYLSIEQFTKAIFYFNKSLKINTKLNLNNDSCVCLQNIGVAYMSNKQNKLALIYFEKALDLAKKINFSKSIVTNNYYLSRLYINTQEYKKALPYIIQAKNGAKEIKNIRLLNSITPLEAEVYIKIFDIKKNAQKDIQLKKAETILLGCVKTFKQSEELDALSSIYEDLSELYTLKNEHKIAKDYYVLRSNIQDSIYNSESKETIKNLEDKRTIDLRNKEIQLNKITLENKEKQKYYFIAGLLLLGVIVSLLFYQSRNRKKNNEKLSFLNKELDESNKAKTRFFSILNHDLRGPVSNLVFFLQLQKESPEMLDEESTKRMQDKTMQGAENLLNSMEDILQWSKSQMENFKPQAKEVLLNHLFEDVKNHFSSFENIKLQFENTENIIVNTDENYLKTIVRNLTGNAIKALEKVENPKIIWKAWQENNKIFLSISDNGNGADLGQFKALYDEKEVVGIKSGLGLHLIRDLAKAIDCEIKVDSNLNGTKFILKL